MHCTCRWYVCITISSVVYITIKYLFLLPHGGNLTLWFSNSPSMFFCMKFVTSFCFLNLFIAGSNYLLHDLEGEIVFINEYIVRQLSLDEYHHVMIGCEHWTWVTCGLFNPSWTKGDFWVQPGYGGHINTLTLVENVPQPGSKQPYERSVKKIVRTVEWYLHIMQLNEFFYFLWLLLGTCSVTHIS